MSWKIRVCVLTFIAVAGVIGFLVGRATRSTDATVARAGALDLAPERKSSEPSVIDDGSHRTSLAPPPIAPSELSHEAPSAPPEKETVPLSENDALIQRLEADRKKLELASKDEQYAAAQRLTCECIAILMDQAGTSLPNPQGAHKLPTEPGHSLFLTNGRIYKFRAGEFPEYDALTKALDAPAPPSGPKSIKDLQDGSWTGFGPNPGLDPETLAGVQQRCDQVLALLRSGR